MQKNAILYCFLVSVIIYIDIINASHFEGGTITYKILNKSGSIVSILLIQTYIYDYTKIACNNSMIANQSPSLYFNPAAYQENNETLNCIQYCNQSGGYIAPGIVSYCTDYSVSLGITVGQRSDIINITNGSYFLVAFQGSNWRPLNLYQSLSWSVSCLISLVLRPDGSYNTPPVATIISPIYIPVGIQQKIFIPTIDADNDQVRCRFANGTNECGGVCPPGSLPNGTIIFSNCTLIITGAKANDWYAVAIEVSETQIYSLYFISREHLIL